MESELKNYFDLLVRLKKRLLTKHESQDKFPIRIDDIVQAIEEETNLGRVELYSFPTDDQISQGEVDRHHKERPKNVLGLSKRTYVPSEDQFYNTVFVDGSLNYEWSRYVTTKELSHLLVSSLIDEFTDRDQPYDLLLQSSKLSKTLPKSFKTSSGLEWLAQFTALELLCPVEFREEIFRIKRLRHVSNEVWRIFAELFRVPETLVEFGLNKEVIELGLSNAALNARDVKRIQPSPRRSHNETILVAPPRKLLTKEPYDFSIELHAEIDSRPLSAREAASVFNSLDRMLDKAWEVGELCRYSLRPQLDRPEWAKKVFAGIDGPFPRIPITPHNNLMFRESIAAEAAYYGEPRLYITSLEHTNPSTLQLTGISFLLCASILTASIAYKNIIEANSFHDHQESKNRCIDAITENISRTTPSERIEDLRAILDYGIEACSSFTPSDISLSLKPGSIELDGGGSDKKPTVSKSSDKKHSSRKKPRPSGKPKKAKR